MNASTFFPILGRTATILIVAPALLSLAARLFGLDYTGIAGLIVGTYRFVAGFLASVPIIEWFVTISPAEIDLIALYGFAVLPLAFGTLASSEGRAAPVGAAAMRLVGLVLPAGLPFTDERLAGPAVAAALMAVFFLALVGWRAYLAAKTGNAALAFGAPALRWPVLAALIALALGFFYGALAAA